MVVPSMRIARMREGKKLFENKTSVNVLRSFEILAYFDDQSAKGHFKPDKASTYVK